MIGWVILFLVAGMGLILAEFFLPGGILGIIGVLLVITSTALGIHSYPGYTLWILLGELTGAGLCVMLGLWVLTRTSALSLLTLKTTQQAGDGYVSAVSDPSLVGKTGLVITALRPAGTIRVGDERLDAVAESVFVDEGRHVRVTEVHGSRIVVEPLDEN